MGSEGGSNVDREDGEQRDEPHLEEGFHWSEEELSGVGSAKLHLLTDRNGQMGSGASPGLGLSWTNRNISSLNLRQS